MTARTTENSDSYRRALGSFIYEAGSRADNQGRLMGEHRQQEDDLDAELPSAQISPAGERRRPDGSAYWSEPEPSNRVERVVA